MPITKAPFLPLAGFWLDRGQVEAVYTFGGQTYSLRQLGRNVFYHVEGCANIEQTCFVCCDSLRGCPDWPSRAKHESYADAEFNADKGHSREGFYPQSAFMAQIRAGEAGRYALHNSKAYRDCSVAMFLRQDGTGVCLHEPRALMQELPLAQCRTAFRWDGQAQGVATTADIVTAPWNALDALCADILARQIVPRMADPFVLYAETPDEPFEYACGSEPELERLTRAILHIHPQFFEEGYKRGKTYHLARSQEGGLTIRYKATTTQQAGGPQSPLKAGRLRLLEIAFEYNALQGGAWRPEYKRQGSRRHNYTMYPYDCHFYILPPSMHEQAEALLYLHDWLEGKVSERERRRLLHLDTPGTRQEDRKA